MARHPRLIGLLGAFLAIGALTPVGDALATSAPAVAEAAPVPAAGCGALRADGDGATIQAIRPSAIDVIDAGDCPGQATTSRPLTVTSVRISPVFGTGLGTVSTDGARVIYNPTSCKIGTDYVDYTITDGVTTATALLVVTIVRPVTAPVTDVPTVTFAKGKAIGSTVPVLVRWCGVSASGTSIGSYRLEQTTNATAQPPVFSALASATTATSWPRTVAVNTSYAWRIRARDLLGRASASSAQSLTTRVTRYQDNGRQIVYSTGWRSASSTRYSGGTERYIAKSGATATLKVTNVRQFAIVASRASRRGSFHVYVDGRRVTSTAISQRSSTTLYRRILYVGSIPGSTAAQHTIQVRSASGYRIDLDTILTMSGRRAPSLSISGPAGATYGDATTASASASSGFPATLSVAQASWAVCSLAGTSLTFHGTGTCTLTATHPADPAWDAVTATRSVPAAPAHLTPMVSAASRPYDGTTVASVSLLNPNLSGRRNGDGPVEVGLDGTRAPVGTFSSAAAGSRTVTVAGLALAGTKKAFYVLDTATTTATITRRSIGVSADPKARVYGAADPAFTFTYSSLVAGETASVIDVPPTCGVAITHVAVGTYPIHCSGGTDNNYQFQTYADGTLKVDRKPVTVTASSPTLTFGSAVPAVTPSYAGFVGSETASVLTAPPVCSTGYTRGAVVGTYKTTCGGAAAANYSFAYVDGVLTVTRATPTVSLTGGTTTVDGNPHGATGFAYGVDGISDVLTPAITVSYMGTGSTTYGPTSTPPSLVGTYLATGTFAGNASYLPGTTTAPVIITDKLTQAIVFGPIADVTYGVAPFGVSATGGGSGNAVVFSSRTASVCTTSGTNGATITVVAAGTCTIRANQAGSAVYAAADPVDRTFGVERKPLTITASSPAPIAYGSAAPSVSASYAGFVASEGPGDLSTPPSCATDYVPGGLPAVYATACAGAASANYEISYTGGSFTVTQKVLPVTFTAQDKTYDGLTAAVVAGCSVTGRVGTDDVTCAYGSATATFVTPGAGADKTVTASGFTLAGSTAGRYLTGTVAPAVATINRRNPVCTVTGYAVTYDGLPHTATGSCTGIPGDALAAADLSATTHTNAGAYPADGWTFTDVSGDYNDTAGTVSNAISKAPQTLTFTSTAPSPALAEGPSYDVTATGGGSGNAVTFSSGSPTICTVSAGHTVSFLIPGTCLVHADQAGSINYLTAPQATQTITVAKNTQTITFAALVDRTYGDLPFTVSATASSGLPVTFTSDTGPVCTVSGTGVTVARPGSCTIRAAQGGNTAWLPATDVTRTFTVQKATLLVTADAKSMTYGGVEPSYTFSYAGFVGNDRPNTIDTKPTCAVNPPPANAGTYTIACSGGIDDKYQFQYVSGVLTVNKANQSITFNAPAPTGAVAGGSIATPTATATSGLAVDVGVDASTAAVCSISLGLLHYDTPGTCKINANQPGDGNWNAAPQVQQSFVIAPGPASLMTSTITAAPGSLAGDGAATSVITVILRDAFGNPLIRSGGTVALAVAGGGAGGTLGPVTDHLDGTYTATYTSPAATGTDTITGALDAQALADDETVVLTAP